MFPMSYYDGTNRHGWTMEVITQGIPKEKMQIMRCTNTGNAIVHVVDLCFGNYRELLQTHPMQVLEWLDLFNNAAKKEFSKHSQPIVTFYHAVSVIKYDNDSHFQLHLLHFANSLGTGGKVDKTKSLVLGGKMLKHDTGHNQNGRTVPFSAN